MPGSRTIKVPPSLPFPGVYLATAELGHHPEPLDLPLSVLGCAHTNSSDPLGQIKPKLMLPFDPLILKMRTLIKRLAEK